MCVCVCVEEKERKREREKRTRESDRKERLNNRRMHTRIARLKMKYPKRATATTYPQFCLYERILRSEEEDARRRGWKRLIRSQVASLACDSR